MAQVQVQSVTKKYGSVMALDGIDVTLSAGVIYGLMGPNGSGKSTLLKSIAGLVRPNAGHILIDGQAPGFKTKAQVAYLPEIDYLYGWMTVDDTMTYFGHSFPDWNASKASSLLDFMKLNRSAKVSALSKGMRARLKIVVAMARDVDVVLLDEPLSGIDPPSRTRIVEAIISEFRSEGQTVVMSTHDVSDAESIFDRVIFLKDGTLALEGNADELREESGKSIKQLFDEVYD